MYFILLLLLFYSVSLHEDLSFLGCSDSSPWWTLFTFNLVHTSFLHWLVNSFVIYSYWRVFRMHLRLIPLFVLLALVPAVSILIAAGPTPTVGASAIGYAMIAVYMQLYSMSRIDKGRNYFLIVLSFLMTGLFAPHINTLVHFCSFMMSFTISGIAKKWMIKT